MARAKLIYTGLGHHLHMHMLWSTSTCWVIAKCHLKSNTQLMIFDGTMFRPENLRHLLTKAVVSHWQRPSGRNVLSLDIIILLVKWHFAISINTTMRLYSTMLGDVTIVDRISCEELHGNARCTKMCTICLSLILTIAPLSVSLAPVIPQRTWPAWCQRTRCRSWGRSILGGPRYRTWGRMSGDGGKGGWGWGQVRKYGYEPLMWWCYDRHGCKDELFLSSNRPYSWYHSYMHGQGFIEHFLMICNSYVTIHCYRRQRGDEKITYAMYTVHSYPHYNWASRSGQCQKEFSLVKWDQNCTC